MHQEVELRACYPHCARDAGADAASAQPAEPWFGVGGSAATGLDRSPGISTLPDLAITAAGQLWVAWEDHSPTPAAIYALRWDGRAWQELAGSASGAGLSGALGGASSARPRLAVDSDGHAMIAWYACQDIEVCNIYLRRWTGSSWEELGGSGSGGGISGTAALSWFPSIDLDPQGLPLVAWEEWDAPGTPAWENHIVLRRWDGAAWQPLDGAASGSGLAGVQEHRSWPDLAVDGLGQPAVAWSYQSAPTSVTVQASRWDGSAWRLLGGDALFPSGASQYMPTLVRDASGGLVAAWQEAVDNVHHIFAARWGGSAWEALAGSLSNGGVTGSALSALKPALASSARAGLVLAWQEYEGPIYFRRFTGTAWEELDGSASNPGLSGDAPRVEGPRVAAGADLICVTWAEPEAAESQVKLRCHRVP